jgi:hypothetical protein
MESKMGDSYRRIIKAKYQPISGNKVTPSALTVKRESDLSDNLYFGPDFNSRDIKTRLKLYIIPLGTLLNSADFPVGR